MDWGLLLTLTVSIVIPFFFAIALPLYLRARCKQPDNLRFYVTNNTDKVKQLRERNKKIDKAVAKRAKKLGL